MDWENSYNEKQCWESDSSSDEKDPMLCDSDSSDTNHKQSSDEKDPMLRDSDSSDTNHKQSSDDEDPNEENQSGQSSQPNCRSKRTKKTTSTSSTSSSNHTNVPHHVPTSRSKSNHTSNASTSNASPTSGAKSIKYEMLSKFDATSVLKLNYADGRSALNEFSTLQHLLDVPVKAAITNVGNHLRQQLARRPENNFTESEISKLFWNATKMSLQDFLCNKPDENTFDTAVCVVLKGLGY